MKNVDINRHFMKETNLSSRAPRIQSGSPFGIESLHGFPPIYLFPISDRIGGRQNGLESSVSERERLKGKRKKREGTPASSWRKTGRNSQLSYSCSASSSSSYSPSSSAVASWYCWYSETRSFMLLSASVNSISSMPSPVYQ